jgi:hypothetical protein
MDASLKELKSQYQQRLLALNSPATAPALVATSATTAKKMTVITHVQPSIVSTLQQTMPQANSFQTIGQADTSSNVKAVIHNDKLVGYNSTVKLLLLEDVQLEGHLIPRNSFFYLPPFALDFPDFLTKSPLPAWLISTPRLCAATRFCWGLIPWLSSCISSSTPACISFLLRTIVKRQLATWLPRSNSLWRRST